MTIFSYTIWGGDKPTEKMHRQFIRSKIDYIADTSHDWNDWPIENAIDISTISLSIDDFRLKYIEINTKSGTINSIHLHWAKKKQRFLTACYKDQ